MRNQGDPGTVSAEWHIAGTAGTEWSVLINDGDTLLPRLS